MNTNSSVNEPLKYRPIILSDKDLPKNITAVTKAKYSTSLDPRGYIPVYEYSILNQPIMWDRETGYVHFTGIWKALSNSKADIVKMVDSNPNLKVKKIRGGFLKIQGTWIPFDIAYTLCTRTARKLRKELVPLFGPRILSDMLESDHPDYGCLLLDSSNTLPSQRAMTSRSNSTTTCQVHHPYQRESVRKSTREKSNSGSSLKTSSSSSSSSSPRQSKRLRKSKNIKDTSNRMAVSRLLNTSEYHGLEQPHQQQLFIHGQISDVHHQYHHQQQYPGNRRYFTESPILTPSPSFRVIPYHPSSHDNTWNDHHRPSSSSSDGCFLPPMFNTVPTSPPSSSSPTSSYHHTPYIAPVYGSPSTRSSSWVSLSSSATHETFTSRLPSEVFGDDAEDIIDTISATILLQRLSQDDGVRPFKPLEQNYIPNKVMVGSQEFRIYWE
ncbi:MAG: hypothetical protein EXX96DRAFT_322885 [Benjaminiella poitrasii]|nr:MAG: hypothetical protein EXX96DRAFT_322885 [Benjaminiella poitrasii]